MWASKQEATIFIYNSNNHVCHVVIFDTVSCHSIKEAVVWTAAEIKN